MKFKGCKYELCARQYESLHTSGESIVNEDFLAVARQFKNTNESRIDGTATLEVNVSRKRKTFLVEFVIGCNDIDGPCAILTRIK